MTTTCFKVLRVTRPRINTWSTAPDFPYGKAPLTAVLANYLTMINTHAKLKAYIYHTSYNTVHHILLNSKSNTQHTM